VGAWLVVGAAELFWDVPALVVAALAIVSVSLASIAVTRSIRRRTPR